MEITLIRPIRPGPTTSPRHKFLQHTRILLGDIRARMDQVKELHDGCMTDHKTVFAVIDQRRNLRMCFQLITAIS
jgi:hypothetical protein